MRRVQRVRHDLVRRELQVRRVETLTPHLRSITFGSETLAGFVSLSFDDHLKLILQQPGEPPVMRDYTPRRFDAAALELTVEFALHGDGPAARWAAQAQPGQHVMIGGPRGSFIVPVDFEWHLLVGDETALPAIARRLEELPAQAQVHVLVLAADPADQRALPSAAAVSTTWVADGAAMLDSLRRWTLPAGEGYAWCAGEASLMAAVRRVLVEDKGHDPRAIRAAAYWKRNVSGHHETIEG